MNEKNRIPLSKMQMSIYLECIAYPERTTYNLPFLCELQQDVDVKRLKKALEAVIPVHPCLDSKIVIDENGEACMQTPAGACVAEFKLSDEEFAARKSELIRHFNINGECLARLEIYITESANYFFYDVHHIAADRFSLKLFLEEVIKVYNGQAIGLVSDLAYELAEEERALSQSEEAKMAKTYWTDLLTTCDTDSTPVADVAQKSAPVQKSIEKEFSIDMDELKDLRERADCRTTIIFTCAFALVIAKYNGADTAVINTVFSGREDSRLSESFGMFVRTVPFVIDLNAYKDTVSFVNAASNQLKQSKEHNLYAFVDMAADLYIKNDILFAFKGKSLRDFGQTPEFAQLIAARSRLYDEEHIEETKLLAEVYEISRGRYCLQLGYRGDVYTDGFADSLADAYICALQSLLREESLSNITLVDEKRLEKLDEFNQNDAPYLNEPLITQFGNMASRYPNHLAVVCGKEKLTYQELDELSERIGAYCVSLGLGAENVVAILLPRCIHIAAAELGAQKAGCAYQPLDPSYPAERLKYMMEDSKAKLLITTNDLKALVTDYAGPILDVEDFSKLPHTKKLNIVPKPHDLFILLYTSGTTGLPKGVQLEQRNLSAFCAWYRYFYQIDHSSRITSYASFGFDASMMDIYSALTNGATLYIIEEKMRLDYMALDQYMIENEITNAFMTTQIGREFAQITKCKTLRCFLLGGETLVPVKLENRPFKLYNCYGPSECTVMSNVFEVDRHYERVPIGRVLKNFKGYVVDKYDNRLPIGACGELLLAGAQVGRGYLNLPEKTREAFVDNPFCSDELYAKTYRTGDIVRYLPDGALDFVGRRDSQVKIRGFRIELSEVEEVVRRFPGIKDATVTAFDDPNGGKAIAAYIVSDENVDIENLRAFILSEKPPYIVPAVIMQIEAIPYNQNQKVNRKALPKPEVSIKAKNSGESIPLNLLERDIAELVESVLHTKVEDVMEKLAWFGLTSISAIRLATLIYKKYGIKIDARSLVADGSLQFIENKIIEEKFAPNQKKEETSSAAEEEKKSCHLGFEQKGVHADCMMDPESTQYNLPFVLSFSTDVKPEELKEAVKTVVSVHKALQSCFSFDANGEAMMELAKDYEVQIPIKNMAKEEFENYKKTFVKAFDLKQVPTRYEIIVSERTNLLFDIHHLIADGSSVDLFIDQLCKVLDGETLEPERQSYFDYVSSQILSLEDDDFFAEQMSRMDESSQLIPDIFEGGKAHSEGNVRLKADLGAITAYAKKNEITPAAIGLAAVQLTISRYLAEDAVAIATISGGRSNLEIADTIGMFVNTLALTSKIDNEQKVTDFIKETADNFQAVIAHEHYPFARLSKKFDFRPYISYAWQVGTIISHCAKGKEVIVTPLALNQAKIPISVFFEEENGDGFIRISYDESMYSKEMMQGFANSINNVASELLTKETLKDVSLTGEEEWKILDSFNRPFDLGYNTEDTAVSRFRYLAKIQPDKIAAVYKDKSYTYKELDELTDKLASVIYDRITNNTGKENLAECVVSILSGRNENAFIMPLAVLKTGCAYEPLDPSYPQERLNFMILDAKASLLIAQDDIRNLLNEYEGDTLLFSELYESEACNLPEIKIRPEDLFIMLYTSGTTGTPKGVQIEHRNVLPFAYGSQLDGFYGNDSVTAAYASFGFDVNMADTFCTLLNGGTLHLIPEEIRMNLDQLAEYFDKNGITEILMTTQVGVQFLQNYPKLKTLRYLMMGGEKLPAVHPENLSYTIINGYGPTENCCGVSMFPIRTWEPNIPIGKPMATIHAYVLDKTGHRLPAGAAGEYCLSGPQVSRGYWNRPDKTDEAYENCPYNEYRMYHTGDIVRYRQNGDVEFVGRKDGQVKIRGFRIETKEVEAVIYKFAGVKDVTVQAYDYESGGKYLVAYVVLEGELNSGELAAFIKASKPAYMVPSAFVQLDRIPLTVNQKIDKKALPKPNVQKAVYVAPKTKAEEDFCDIFGKVLGIEKVGAEDDFFEIGGSSILAMKVVLAASKEGYSIVYQNVFDCSTPKDLAALVGEDKNQDLAIEENHESETSADWQTPYGPFTKEIDPEGYDYSKINALLRENTYKAFENGKKQELDTVLLLGATGYLGSHVLHELLTCEKGKIICLVRSKTEFDARKRLQKVYNQYFDGAAEKIFDERLLVIPCEEINKEALEKVQEENLTVINCAASVKHFAKGNEIEKVNLGSVKSIIFWCLAHNSRLVHVSTESVMGSAVGHMPPMTFKFNENVLYVGQRYEDNQYVRSKFLGERAIYEAIINDNLNARVVRVGNLAPREDGQFQTNFESNSFMKTLAAYKAVGAVPYTAGLNVSFGAGYATMDALVEFSPIEKVAQAVRLLSKAPKECVCFVASNNHLIHFGDIVLALSEEERPVTMVDGDTFATAVKECFEDPKKASRISELIAYASGESDVVQFGPTNIDNSLTMAILYNAGFRWPETGEDYVKRFADKLRKLGFSI
ncbi:MAG: amino acid adenylation domain-containing protein [Eubacteriales bacterium]|nr:amino acid adenylation domain-containing protein [Eubacteriales bacterium]